MSIIKINEKIKGISSYISAISLILMVGVVFIQTFTRFVIFYSIPWSEEASRYLFIIMIVIGFNAAISNKEMIRISVIDDFLTPSIKKILDHIIFFISLLVISIFSYSAFNLIGFGYYQLSPAMQIPMSIMYIIMFLGLSLSLFSVAIDGYIKFNNNKNELED